MPCLSNSPCASPCRLTPSSERKRRYTAAFGRRAGNLARVEAAQRDCTRAGWLGHRCRDRSVRRRFRHPKPAGGFRRWRVNSAGTGPVTRMAQGPTVAPIDAHGGTLSAPARQAGIGARHSGFDASRGPGDHCKGAAGPRGCGSRTCTSPSRSGRGTRPCRCRSPYGVAARDAYTMPPGSGVGPTRHLLAGTMPRRSRALPPSPFRRFNSSSEVIRLVVMMYVRFSLSCGMSRTCCSSAGSTSVMTVRFWWNRFGPMFAGEVRRQRVSRMRGFRYWRWHLDEMYVTRRPFSNLTLAMCDGFAPQFRPFHAWPWLPKSCRLATDLRGRISWDSTAPTPRCRVSRPR